MPGFEDTGAAVGPAEIADSMTWDGVVGLGEMMNFPGVLAGTDHAHGELAATLAADKVVTGHYSIPETDQGLNAYIASGVRCCHESTRAEDALAKMRLGQYAQLRYGSAWLDLPNLAAAITETGIDTRLREPHLRRHAPAHARGQRTPRLHPAQGRGIAASTWCAPSR